ncbi:MAG: hypothetical protein N4A71_05685 [Carboxylicivirga sp.]|jgi:hypothetical protein|nr:hypothetical protein [Carboxylicivirga sp.]
MKELLIVGGLFTAAVIYSNRPNHPFIKTIKSTIAPDSFPLKPGDNNEMVANVQKALINLGGEYSNLVMAGGGVNGEFNEQTAQALKRAGFIGNISKMDYQKLITNNQALRNIAYVIDVDGTPIYSGVSDSHIPNYGYGRDLIMKLPCKTHLGTATGNFRNGMVEIATNINSRRVKFWVPTSKTGMLSQAEYDAMKSTRVLPKSDEAKMKLLKV